ncbi:type II secretion system F family protein [Suipraeoptans intestinalis]|nr:type II secretion system F family protein [Suipraeoptans intestinalis]MDD7770619.1 type II secretion system F family protein [Suipraeoptans intestinalis]MDY3121170.1 type II secretion system F family protein [Suipraeoptans intestinalis]
MTQREILRLAGKSMGIVTATAWLYYRSLWAILFLTPLWIIRMREGIKKLEKKKEAEFLKQFQNLLQMLSSSLMAGYSLENAMKEVQKEIKVLYGKHTRIQKELNIMIRQLNIQMPVEDIWKEMADRVRTDDVNTFAEVLGAAKRSGAGMLEILRDTGSQIGEKIEVKREIDGILAAKTYELKVMTMIPYGMIAYMTVSFPEFLKGLYGSVLGKGVMTGCLALYLGACCIGTKILEIEV